MNERMEHGHIIDEHIDDDMYDIDEDDHKMVKRKNRRADWEDF